YGRIRIPSIQLSTAAFVPMPSVRQSSARMENPGLRRSILNPKRRSWRNVCILFASFKRLVLCGHTILDDAAIKQVHGAICVLRETLIVGDHANRGTTLMEFAKQVHDRFAIVRIQVTGRLVC